MTPTHPAPVECHIQGFRDMPPETQQAMVRMMQCAADHLMNDPVEKALSYAAAGGENTHEHLRTLASAVNNQRDRMNTMWVALWKCRNHFRLQAQELRSQKKPIKAEGIEELQLLCDNAMLAKRI